MRNPATAWRAVVGSHSRGHGLRTHLVAAARPTTRADLNELEIKETRQPLRYNLLDQLRKILHITKKIRHYMLHYKYTRDVHTLKSLHDNIVQQLFAEERANTFDDLQVGPLLRQSWVLRTYPKASIVEQPAASF